MTRRKGSKDYPEWMKREAIRLHQEEGWSAGEILDRYSIRDRNRINAWVRQYRAEGEAMFAGKRSRSGRKPKRENTAAYIARLEMENDLLKKFHAELRRDSLVKRNIGSSNTTEEDTK
jgi:transposase-like protein